MLAFGETLAIEMNTVVQLSTQTRNTQTATVRKLNNYTHAMSSKQIEMLVAELQTSD